MCLLRSSNTRLVMLPLYTLEYQEGLLENAFLRKEPRRIQQSLPVCLRRFDGMG